MRKLVLAVAIVMVMTTLNTNAALAQGYTGWVEHPYPSVDYFWCEYFGDEYWCWSPLGEMWFPANPNWYNQAYDEMLRVYGQGIL